MHFLLGVIQNQQNYVVYVLNGDKNREKGAKWGDRREKKNNVKLEGGRGYF